MCDSCDCACKSCKPSYLDKWRYTLITTLIFLVVVSPLTYGVTQRILGKYISISKGGCPTTIGIMLHAVVFTLALRYFMDLE